MFALPPPARDAAAHCLCYVEGAEVQPSNNFEHGLDAVLEHYTDYVFNFSKVLQDEDHWQCYQSP